MSKFDFKKLREQCQSTGKMLQETFKGTDNMLIGLAQRDSDPNYIKNKNEGITKRTNSEDWKRKQKENAAKLSANPHWQKEHANRNKKLALDSKWIEQNNKGVQKRIDDPNWNKNVRNAARKNFAKPCITPLGIFPTGVEAGKAYNESRKVTNGNNAVCNALKKGKEGYRYITVEEYILLTGKNI
jgi:type II secretory pathway pseudopilin PulG